MSTRIKICEFVTEEISSKVRNEASAKYSLAVASDIHFSVQEHWNNITTLLSWDRYKTK